MIRNYFLSIAFLGALGTVGVIGTTYQVNFQEQWGKPTAAASQPVAKKLLEFAVEAEIPSEYPVISTEEKLRVSRAELRSSLENKCIDELELYSATHSIMVKEGLVKGNYDDKTNQDEVAISRRAAKAFAEQLSLKRYEKVGENDLAVYCLPGVELSGKAKERLERQNRQSQIEEALKRMN